LWECVEKTEACWVRHAAGFEQGQYTKIRVGSKRIKAHRLAWEEATGETLTTTDLICHTCDNPPCIRNDEVGTYEVEGITYPRRGHLFKTPGHMPNARDKVAKGRLKIHTGADHWANRQPERVMRGEAHPSAKLTDADILSIRHRHGSGEATLGDLAAEYSLNKSTVERIVHRSAWRHVQ
jgi:hypothetical protein